MRLFVISPAWGLAFLTQIGVTFALDKKESTTLVQT